LINALPERAVIMAHGLQGPWKPEIDLRSEPSTRQLIIDRLSGAISCAKMQKHAAKSIRQYGTRHVGMQQLASLGSNGLHPNHFERDFHRLRYARDNLVELPDPQMINLPVKCKTGPGIEIRSFPILFPHDLFRSMFKGGDRVFDLFLRGDQGRAGVAEYWDHIDRYSHTAPGDEVPDKHHCIPMCMHGDDAGLFLKEKVLIMQMNSFLADHATMDCCLLLCSIPYESVIDTITIPALYEWLAWSMTAASLGIEPSTWPDGTPITGWRDAIKGRAIAERWRLIWEFNLGDWKYLKECFHLNAYGHANCCHICKASKRDPTLIYWDHRINAGWRDTCIATSDYVHAQGAQICGFCKVPYWNLYKCWVDCMHCVDLGYALRVRTQSWAQPASQPWHAWLPRQPGMPCMHCARRAMHFNS
jgi:hypothetical protein